MGRAPCCDKANVKKGPWSPEEDSKLKAYIEENGTGGNWIALPQKIGLRRCGKSCRLRWLNYLRPNIKHGGFSEEEDNIICSLYISIGSRWSIIAAQLPGRTDNDIKNYWNTRLKKKLLGKQRKEQQLARRANSFKQEIKRESESYYSMVPSAEAMFSNQQMPACWQPEVPSLVMPAVMNPSQEYHSHFMDQESIKNLLIKLGGRFSDDHNHQEPSFTTPNYYPLDASYSTHEDQLHGNSIAACSQLPNNDYGVINTGGVPNSMCQGLDCFRPAELDELIYGNPQQWEGLMEGFYGMEMGNVSNGGATSSSVESSSLGNNISPLVYPQLVSEYETNCLQSNMPQQDSPFEVSSYFGPQL